MTHLIQPNFLSVSNEIIDIPKSSILHGFTAVTTLQQIDALLSVNDSEFVGTNSFCPPAAIIEDLAHPAINIRRMSLETVGRDRRVFLGRAGTRMVWHATNQRSRF